MTDHLIQLDEYLSETGDIVYNDIYRLFLSTKLHRLLDNNNIHAVYIATKFNPKELLAQFLCNGAFLLASTVYMPYVPGLVKTLNCTKKNLHALKIIALKYVSTMYVFKKDEGESTCQYVYNMSYVEYTQENTPTNKE